MGDGRLRSRVTDAGQDGAGRRERRCGAAAWDGGGERGICVCPRSRYSISRGGVVLVGRGGGGHEGGRRELDAAATAGGARRERDQKGSVDCGEP